MKDLILGSYQSVDISHIRCTFRILGGGGWRDSYGKTEILAGWVTKICLKCTKKLG